MDSNQVKGKRKDTAGKIRTMSGRGGRPSMLIAA
jgi:hypothetical protein